MKFIISTFSLGKMFIDPDFDLKVHQVNEEEFQALILDAYSCVGYKDIATILNVAFNKEPVKAREGDILLLADKYNGKMNYFCIQVCKSEAPLRRVEETDEEMIYNEY